MTTGAEWGSTVFVRRDRLGRLMVRRRKGDGKVMVRRVKYDWTWRRSESGRKPKRWFDGGSTVKLYEDDDEYSTGILGKGLLELAVAAEP